MSLRATRSNLGHAIWNMRQEFQSGENGMDVVERLAVVVVALMSALLLFVSPGRSWEQKARVSASDGNDCRDSPTSRTGPSTGKSPSVSFVANPFCKACHLDFDEEELALNHEIWGIGCERCHGESLRHRSDEANLTPPELMYPKERVNPMCMMCHPRHDIRDTKDHLPILEAGLSVFEEMTPIGADAKKYCTDCHGTKHRITKTRAVRWDKATGTLLKKETQSPNK